jgi:hypothetical protein
MSWRPKAWTNFRLQGRPAVAVQHAASDLTAAGNGSGECSTASWDFIRESMP